MVAKSRKFFSNTYGFQRDATTVSYCPKKNRAVSLLSTMHNDKDFESWGENKPEIFQYYYSTKEEIEIMEQIVRYYIT